MSGTSDSQLNEEWDEQEEDQGINPVSNFNNEYLFEETPQSVSSSNRDKDNQENQENPQSIIFTRFFNGNDLNEEVNDLPFKKHHFTCELITVINQIIGTDWRFKDHRENLLVFTKSRVFVLCIIWMILEACKKNVASSLIETDYIDEFLKYVEGLTANDKEEIANDEDILKLLEDLKKYPLIIQSISQIFQFAENRREKERMNTVMSFDHESSPSAKRKRFYTDSRPLLVPDNDNDYSDNQCSPPPQPPPDLGSIYVAFHLFKSLGLGEILTERNRNGIEDELSNLFLQRLKSLDFNPLLKLLSLKPPLPSSKDIMKIIINKLPDDVQQKFQFWIKRECQCGEKINQKEFNFFPIFNLQRSTNSLQKIMDNGLTRSVKCKCGKDVDERVIAMETSKFLVVYVPVFEGKQLTKMKIGSGIEELIGTTLKIENQHERTTNDRTKEPEEEGHWKISGIGFSLQNYDNCHHTVAVVENVSYKYYNDQWKPMNNQIPSENKVSLRADIFAFRYFSASASPKSKSQEDQPCSSASLL